MAIAFKGGDSQSNIGGGAVTIPSANLPTLNDDDVLIAWGVGNSIGAWTVSGFTQVCTYETDAFRSLYVGYKVCSSESGDYVLDGPGAVVFGQILVFSGVDTSEVINNSGAAYSNLDDQTSDQYVSLGTITTDSNATLLVLVWNGHDYSHTTPTNYTNTNESIADTYVMNSYYRLDQSSGEKTGFDVTMSGSGAEKHGFFLGLTEEPSSTPVTVNPGVITCSSSVYSPSLYTHKIVSPSTISGSSAVLGVAVSTQIDAATFGATGAVLSSNVIVSDYIESEIANASASVLQVGASASSYIYMSLAEIYVSVVDPELSIDSASEANVYPETIAVSGVVNSTSESGASYVAISTLTANAGTLASSVEIEVTKALGDVISVSTSVLAFTISVGDGVTPATIETQATVHQPSLVGGSVVAAGTISVSSAVISPTVYSSGLVVPTIATSIASLLAITTSACALLNPNRVGISGTLLPISISVGDGATPATITTGALVLAPSILGEGVIVTEVCTSTCAVHDVVVSSYKIISPNLAEAQASVIEATVSAEAACSPATVSASASVMALSISVGDGVTTATLTAQAEVHSAVLSGGSREDVDVIAATSSVHEHTIVSQGVITPSVAEASGLVTESETYACALVTPDVANGSGLVLGFSISVGDGATPASIEAGGNVLTVDLGCSSLIEAEIVEASCLVNTVSLYGGASVYIDSMPIIYGVNEVFYLPTPILDAEQVLVNIVVTWS